MLLFGAIGAAVGVVISLSNGNFLHSPAETAIGGVAYIIGLLLPTTIIGVLIGYFNHPKKPNSN